VREEKPEEPEEEGEELVEEESVEESEIGEEEEAAEESEVVLEEGEAAQEETVPKEEGEEEKEPSRREEEKEEFVEEKVYIIPLQRAWIMPPNKRAPKAIRLIKAFVKKHMKVGEKAVKEEGEEEEGGRIIISNEVNRKVWSKGIEKPPRKLKIRAARDEEGNVTVFLA
jgi:large subunit ribosomal protein L31e